MTNVPLSVFPGEKFKPVGLFSFFPVIKINTHCTMYTHKQNPIYLLCLLCFLFTNALYAQEPASRFTIKGYAFAAEAAKAPEATPLAGAEVIVWGRDSVAQLIGIAGENGYFEYPIEQRPVKIQIRHIGYSPYTNERPVFGPSRILSLDTCFLSSDLVLDEIVVSGTGVAHSVGAESYLVTRRMREKATNTYDLLDQIHGVRYDKMTNAIRVGNETKVKILVDDMEQSKEYIASINPERIARIEISKHPEGRYQSEGYEAVVNLRLKEGYRGYDVTVQHLAVLNPGNNGDDWLMTDQPSLQMVYTDRRLNVFANYTYGYASWNTPVARKVGYADRLFMDSEATSADRPNDLYAYKAHLLYAGINYKLNPRHTLSFTGSYMYEKTRTDDLFHYRIRDLEKDTAYTQWNNTMNMTSYDDYTGTLFYKGTAADDRLRLYGDVSYNYYTNEAANALTGDGSVFSLLHYREKRNYVKFNWDMEYKLSALFTLKFGYSDSFRKYDSEALSGDELLRYKELRNKGYAYLKFSPSEKLAVEIGTGLENIRIKQTSARNRFLQFLPVFQFNYKATGALNLKASYLTSMAYPTIYELNPVASAIDSLMDLQGNPALRASVRHALSADISLWDRLTFAPRFRYTPRAIGQWVEPSGDRYLTTFRNVKMKSYAFQLMYDQPAGDYVSFSNSLTYYSDKAAYGGEAYRAKGWLLESEVSYFHPAYAWMVQGGYYRSMRKKAEVQGFGMEDLDSWGLSVSKKFWRNRLSVMLVYFTPLEWGIRKEQKKEIRTPCYREAYTTSLKPYRNMFLLRISFRFGSGKVNFVEKNTEIEKDKRIRRTVGF